jgi:hypothetical protein
MKESCQSNWRDSNGWRMPGRHAGRDGATSYQSRQLGRHDWCLSRASLFSVTQFPEYIAPPSFSFFLLTFFLLTFSLHLTAAPLAILTSPLKSYPMVL